MAITIGQSENSEPHTQGERAIIVHAKLSEESHFDSQDRLREFLLLAESAGATIVEVIEGQLRHINPSTWLGSGKLDEIKQRVADTKADIVLINGDITAAQERNIEGVVECRLLTRTGLILDIFASRARSHEGKLQVELAQLEHVSTRLVRGWTHLERQKGGIGLRGPGETQLEMDKRMIGLRMKQLKAKLAKVSASRSLRRKRRKRIPVPTISLVGYTNAGKSTLFNLLTESNVYAADQLFATLDPTMRKLVLPSGREVVLSDTVGFVRDLPHQLVNAFHSTLEEVTQADLLLHVIDGADERQRDLIDDVEQVLAEISDENSLPVPQLHVYNKLDLIDDGIPRKSNKHQVYVSAVTAEGVERLREEIDAFFDREMKRFNVDLAPHEGEKRASVYQNCRVIEEHYDELGYCHLIIEASDRIKGQLDQEQKWSTIN